jgi:hypothetical protein
MKRPERDALVARFAELFRSSMAIMKSNKHTVRDYKIVQNAYCTVLGEYYDAMPELVLGVCPFTGEKLVEHFDPFGLDGPLWHKEPMGPCEQPAPPPTFQVLLGALALRGRKPEEVKDAVLPGPDLPFVVPRLLELPGMVAVLSQRRMETGDVAYPIAYFSEEEIDLGDLHQRWLRQEHWYTDASGAECWSVMNDEWDYDLRPHIEAGKLLWFDAEPPEFVLHGAEQVDDCPFLELEGDGQPQELEDGERSLLEAPGGDPYDPFNT